MAEYEEDTLDNPQDVLESSLDDSEDNSEEQDTGDDKAPVNKNKSNFKKISSENKRLRQENAELLKLKEWANSLYDNEDEKPFRKEEVEKEALNNETLDDVVTFYQKNAEALEYKDEILQTMQEYGIDRTRAWKLVKSDIPEESKTKRLFSANNKTPAVKKNLADYTPDEALKLTKEQKREWRQLKGMQ